MSTRSFPNGTACSTTLPQPNSLITSSFGYDFSALENRDYSDVSGEAVKNAMLLEQALASYGF